MKTIKLFVSALMLSGVLLAGFNSLAFASSNGNSMQANAIEGRGVGFGGNGAGTGLVNGCDGTCTTGTVSTTELTQSEKDALLYMVEEEKLARDIYQVLATKWDLPLFANIARSEQTHMNAISTLISRYGLTSPVSGESGVFTNPTLQSLYTRLTQKGSVSLVDALLVGGAIEELDIQDLNTRLETVTHSDVKQVFTNLKSGSYSHLRAFANEYENETGKVYTPQTLSAEDYQTAIESPSSIYGARGMGRGGNGMQ